MLVLSRKQHEKIIIGSQIGSQIEITVAEIRGDKVRLAITAPKEISVHRQEVWASIQQHGQIKKAS